VKGAHLSNDGLKLPGKAVHIVWQCSLAIMQLSGLLFKNYEGLVSI